MKRPALIAALLSLGPAGAAADELSGADKLRVDELPSMGAEDFAYMLLEKPGCYVWLGNGPGTGGCSLHNPHYDFNDEALQIGASYWVTLAEQQLPVRATWGPAQRSQKSPFL